jgi:hypothetical protein
MTAGRATDDMDTAALLRSLPASEWLIADRGDVSIGGPNGTAVQPSLASRQLSVTGQGPSLKTYS